MSEKKPSAVNSRSALRPGREAFTLLEMIGVVTVLAILASILMPLFVRQMDRLAADKEANELQTLTQGLKQSILRTKSVPDQNGWYLMLASNLGMQTNDVLLNARRLRRCYLIDPNIQIGSNTGRLPYIQTNTGSVVTDGAGFYVPPQNARLMFLSSISTPLPNSIQSGAGLPASDFEALWNLPEGSAPGSWSGWSQRGEDLKIQRINLTPLFKRLVLNNDDATSAPGWYSIDNSRLVSLASGNRLEAFFLEATVLGLYDGANTNSPMASQALVRDSSFFYERGSWLGTVIFGLSISGSQFELIASLFLESPWNINATAGTKQLDVANALINYMRAYEAWADGGFPSSGPLEDAVVNTRATVITYDNSLMNNPMATNCP